MSELGAQIIFKQLIDRHHRIKIPIIQRDFAQGRDTESEVREEFLNSLHTALISQPEDESLPLNLDFIYGSIEGDTDKRFLPLDGQQRLTTLFLLHWYLAWKDGDHVNFQEAFSINDESRFIYSVRPSSTEFFNALVNYVPDQNLNGDVSLSSDIKNQSWFYSYWRLDPTIQSCLRMLDTIHDKFFDTAGLYSRLYDTEQPAITFQLLDLDNFGLSDDLYIKMNARGKPLTDFETFKARYEQELKNIFSGETKKIGDKSFSVAEYFSISIDNVWSDFFWSHRDKDTDLYDEAVMNLFRTIALLTRDVESDNFLNSWNILRNKSDPASYTVFHNEGWLDRDFSELLFILLEVWSKDSNNLSARLPNSKYFDEAKIIHTILNDPTSIDATETVQLMGYVIYLRENADDINEVAFEEWMRLVFNLSVNTSYERPADIQRSLSGLLKISSHSRNILNYFANTEKPVAGFSMQQISEEQIKAKLILADSEWKPLLISAENHGYFKGQIEFLLVFCGLIFSYRDSEEHRFKSHDYPSLKIAFSKYLSVAEVMFNNRGLADLGDYKWERALLSVGDYFIPSGSNFSYGVNSSTDQASWKRLLRGTGNYVSQARQYLQKLWDQLLVDGDISIQLESLIDTTKNIEAWRQAFIDTPDAFKYCAKSAVRFTPDGEIFLLTKTQMNGTYAELFSYCLYKNEIEPLRIDGSLSPFTTVQYLPVIGTEDYPCIQLFGEFNHKWLQVIISTKSESSFDLEVSRESADEFQNLWKALKDQLKYKEGNSALSTTLNIDEAEQQLNSLMSVIRLNI